MRQREPILVGDLLRKLFHRKKDGTIDRENSCRLSEAGRLLNEYGIKKL